MTPERAKELLPIIQAYGEGKTIQVRYPESPEWDEFKKYDFDDCDKCEYRIKPEPKVIYVNEFDDGDIRAYKYEQDAMECQGRLLMRRVAVKYIEASD